MSKSQTHTPRHSQFAVHPPLAFATPLSTSTSHRVSTQRTAFRCCAGGEIRIYQHEQHANADSCAAAACITHPPTHPHAPRAPPRRSQLLHPNSHSVHQRHLCSTRVVVQRQLQACQTPSPHTQPATQSSPSSLLSAPHIHTDTLLIEDNHG
jgi:hypothetical protein